VVWLSTTNGILQLFIVILLIRELFGIRYDDEQPVSSTASTTRRSPAEQRPAESSNTTNSSTTSSSSDNSSDNSSETSEALDDLQDDETELKSSYDGLTDRVEALLTVYQQLRQAAQNDDTERVTDLATKGAEIIGADGGLQESFAHTEDTVQHAAEAVSDVKQRLGNELVQAREDATVTTGASSHRSGADGILASDIQAVESIPDGFFTELIESFDDATAEEQAGLWRKGYEQVGRFPQFHPPSWTDPRRVEAVAAEDPEVLENELQRMHEMYEMVKEQLPDDLSVDEADSENEEALHELHQAMSIVEAHHQVLQDLAETYDVGQIRVGDRVTDNTTSIASLLDELQSGFEQLAGEPGRDDVDDVVERLEQLLQPVGSTAQDLHDAIRLYTEGSSIDETIEQIRAAVRNAQRSE
jgi:predicted nuclease with TOPRIM domain